MRLIAGAPDLDVVTASPDLARITVHTKRAQPHVVCIDVANGKAVEITRRIMAEDPRPILVLTSKADGPDAPVEAFAVLEAGAVDIMPRPQVVLEEDTAELRTKLRVLAGVRVVRRHAHNADMEPRAAPPRRRPQLVVIGASTGGPPALAHLLGNLPCTFPLPILCVQHIARGFLSGFSEWLDHHCDLRVKQVDEGEAPRPGTVYLPRDDTHLLVGRDRRLTLSHEPPVDGHRPSVTLAMRSAARHCDGAVIGVLLTGMGRDGTDGMGEIANRGGVTIAQDEATSAVFGMPRQAIVAGHVQHVLPIDKMAARLMREALLAK